MGRVVVRTREKNSRFNRGVRERRADKNGNRGWESSGKLKSSSKGGTCLSSLFDEMGLCLKIIFISGVHNVRTDPGTGYCLAPAPPPIDPSLDLTRRPLYLNVCNRLFMIKPLTNIFIILSITASMSFSPGIPKYGLYTHPFIELNCSPLLLLAYTRFSVRITVTVSGEK